MIHTYLQVRCYQKNSIKLKEEIKAKIHQQKMAIDIVLTKNRLRQKFNIETSIRFDDSGDYQFLQPFFEKLRVKTSEIIDLYDDCEFEGENLIKLKNELEKEIFRLSKQKEEKWSVFIGIQTLPFKKEIYREVR